MEALWHLPLRTPMDALPILPIFSVSGFCFLRKDLWVSQTWGLCSLLVGVALHPLVSQTSQEEPAPLWQEWGSITRALSQHLSWFHLHCEWSRKQQGNTFSHPNILHSQRLWEIARQRRTWGTEEFVSKLVYFYCGHSGFSYLNVTSKKIFSWFYLNNSFSKSRVMMRNMP